MDIVNQLIFSNVYLSTLETSNFLSCNNVSTAIGMLESGCLKRVNFGEFLQIFHSKNIREVNYVGNILRYVDWKRDLRC